MHKTKEHLSKLNAVFFKTEREKEPVRDWLFILTKVDRRQIGEEIAYVQFKWPIGKPHVDHLSGPIWEVRVTLKTRIARVLFAIEGDVMVLLHGFIKKSQATDKSDINLALSRFKDWKKYHGKK